MLGCLGGCATPLVQQTGESRTQARLEAAQLVMADGEVLPLSVWQSQGDPKAIMLALHGFNDYRQAFASVGPFLAQRGIVVYAYDQRGFGSTRGRGIWPGAELLIDDVRATAALLRQSHPGLPFYLLGESMGGAVAISALAEAPQLADGVALVAPAVWGRAVMNPLQRAVLWTMAHSTPALKLTGKSLNIMASDNLAMLRALGKDPMVIKGARVDAVWGLFNLMDRALEATPRLTVPALVLYGERDQIIPRRPICSLLAKLGPTTRAVVYPDGYHMLTRDLKADVVLNDLAHWLRDPAATVPASNNPQAWQRFCAASQRVQTQSDWP